MGSHLQTLMNQERRRRRRPLLSAAGQHSFQLNDLRRWGNTCWNSLPACKKGFYSFGPLSMRWPLIPSALDLLWIQDKAQLSRNPLGELSNPFVISPNLYAYKVFSVLLQIALQPNFSFWILSFSNLFSPRSTSFYRYNMTLIVYTTFTNSNYLNNYLFTIFTTYLQ